MTSKEVMSLALLSCPDFWKGGRFMRSIGERLKEWRLAAGMKQDIAAMRMDMSRTTLSAIEAGKREVLAKEIPGFVKLYGKSPEELLEGINGKENSGIMTENMEQFADRVTDELIDRLDERGIINISMAVHDVSHQEDKLMSYAQSFHVDKMIRQYMEVLL